MADIKYPNQIYKCARTDKTLGIDALLFAADTKNGQSPLELHAGYSRFVLTILKKKGENYVPVTANIPPRELDLIKKKSEIAVEKLMSKTTVEQPELSVAYTEKFFTGTFKGKTPADVLQNPSNKEALLEYRKQLEQNVEKYPVNKTKIKAIDEAIHLLDSGALRDGEPTSSTQIDIYRADIRAPHATKVDSEGYTDVYSISIVFDSSLKYPFAINISNCKAKITKNTNGTLSPNMSQKKPGTEEDANILLTDAEWFSALSRMERTNSMFEAYVFKEMFSMARDLTSRKTE